MTSTIRLWSAEEDGLSLLNLEEPSGNGPEKEFYYRLEDVQVPFRFQLVSVIGDRLETRYAEASGWIAIGDDDDGGGFKLDRFKEKLFGENVELRIRYCDLKRGCRLVLLLKGITEGTEYRVSPLPLFTSDGTLKQGQYKVPFYLASPSDPHLLHMESVPSLCPFSSQFG